MENEDLAKLRRDYNSKIDGLQRKYLRLKRTVAVIFNLFIPGLGFVVFDKHLHKGLISFVLFYGYSYLYFTKILPNIGGLGSIILYFLPVIIIWIISAVIVAELSE